MSVVNGYLIRAAEKERERVAWEMWLALYPQMQLKRIQYFSFNDFKRELYQPMPPMQITAKTAEEIEQEMAAVVTTYEGR